MKKIVVSYFVFVVCLGFLAFTLVPSDKYKVGEGFKIAFRSADPSGNFEEMSGSIDFDKANPEKSKFNLSIKVASIKTGNGMRDKKALTEEWFHAAKYPNITFVSSSMVKTDNGYAISGTLSMKGVSKKIVIPCTMSDLGKKIVFKGNFSVNRLEYGVGKKSDVVPGVMKIKFEVPAVKV